MPRMSVQKTRDALESSNWVHRAKNLNYAWIPFTEALLGTSTKKQTIRFSKRQKANVSLQPMNVCKPLLQDNMIDIRFIKI